MCLSWNVNASEQECQVQLYNGVSGINIQYSSPLIDFGTVGNTRSTKEEISFVCQNHNQQSKLWADKQLVFILCNRNRKRNMETGRLQMRSFHFLFNALMSQGTNSTWVLGVLLWHGLTFAVSKASSTHLYPTSECWHEPCMQQEISHSKTEKII